PSRLRSRTRRLRTADRAGRSPKVRVQSGSRAAAPPGESPVRRAGAASPQTSPSSASWSATSCPSGAGVVAQSGEIPDGLFVQDDRQRETDSGCRPAPACESPALAIEGLDVEPVGPVPGGVVEDHEDGIGGAGVWN